VLSIRLNSDSSASAKM